MKNKLLDFIHNYKVIILLCIIYVLITMVTIAIIDVNNKEEVISNQSNTIFQLTDRVLELHIILSEVEELLRIRKDLSKVKK